MHTFLTSTLLALSAALPATAQEASPTPWKFTTGLYHLSGGGLASEWALDLNLRYASSWGNAWVGWFRAPRQDLQQARAGWDRTFDLGILQVQPSLQIASGGFRGGSLYAETGDDWYLGAGLGRTNLRPYVNLNFDPNDAWTLAAGRRWADRQSLGLLLVGDNRQNPDQRHLHLVWRKPLEAGQRLTVTCSPSGAWWRAPWYDGSAPPWATTGPTISCGLRGTRRSTSRHRTCSGSRAGCAFRSLRGSGRATG